MRFPEWPLSNSISLSSHTTRITWNSLRRTPMWFSWKLISKTSANQRSTMLSSPRLERYWISAPRQDIDWLGMSTLILCHSICWSLILISLSVWLRLFQRCEKQSPRKWILRESKVWLRLQSNLSPSHNTLSKRSSNLSLSKTFPWIFSIWLLSRLTMSKVTQPSVKMRGVWLEGFSIKKLASRLIHSTTSWICWLNRSNWYLISPSRRLVKAIDQDMMSHMSRLVLLEWCSEIWVHSANWGIYSRMLSLVLSSKLTCKTRPVLTWSWVSCWKLDCPTNMWEHQSSLMVTSCGLLQISGSKKMAKCQGPYFFSTMILKIKQLNRYCSTRLWTLTKRLERLPRFYLT